jgi:hypothetical protein
MALRKFSRTDEHKRKAAREAVKQLSVEERECRWVENTLDIARGWLLGARYQTCTSGGLSALITVLRSLDTIG